MGRVVFSDHAQSTLAATLGAGGTSISLQAGDGDALFSSPSGGNYGYVCVQASTGSWEIIKFDTRSGDVLSGLTRDVNSYPGGPLEFAAGSLVFECPCQAVFEELIRDGTADEPGRLRTASNAETAAMAANNRAVPPSALAQQLDLHLAATYRVLESAAAMFRLSLTVDGGVLKHCITAQMTGGAVGGLVVPTLVSGHGTGLNPTRPIGPAIGFNSGVGATTGLIVFDRADAGSYAALAKGHGTVNVLRCTDAALSLQWAGFEASYENVNGTAGYRPAIQLRDSSGNAVNPFSLAEGKWIILDINGFFY